MKTRSLNVNSFYFYFYLSLFLCFCSINVRLLNSYLTDPKAKHAQRSPGKRKIGNLWKRIRKEGEGVVIEFRVFPAPCCYHDHIQDIPSDPSVYHHLTLTILSHEKARRKYFIHPFKRPTKVTPAQQRPKHFPGRTTINPSRDSTGHFLYTQKLNARMRTLGAPQSELLSNSTGPRDEWTKGFQTQSHQITTAFRGARFSLCSS